MQPVKRRILCVDDNDDICQMLTRLFAREGYETAPASTVEEAMRLARAERFDLFVLDKITPHFDLCRELRRVHADRPIVIYSADAFERHHREASEAGATAYVDKPGVEPLVSAVKKLLA